MVVNVTQADICDGRRGSPWSCPIALAIRRLLIPEDAINCFYFSVSRQFASLGDRQISMPDVARDFIERFDANKSVGPLEFELPDHHEWNYRTWK